MSLVVVIKTRRRNLVRGESKGGCVDMGRENKFVICKIQRNVSTRYFQSEVIADLSGMNGKDRALIRE